MKHWYDRLTVYLLYGILVFVKVDGKNSRNIKAFINESAELADARKNGVDLWALWHNLQRTPAERMRRHDIALGMMRRLQKAKTL